MKSRHYESRSLKANSKIVFQSDMLTFSDKKCILKPKGGVVMDSTIKDKNLNIAYTDSTTWLDDDVWSELEYRLRKEYAWRGKGEEKRMFIETVLWRLLEKIRDNDTSVRMHWKTLEKQGDNSASFNRKFNRWRDNGTWITVLKVLSKHEEYNWIFNFGIYEIFFKECTAIRDINRVIYELNVNNLKDKIHELSVHLEKLSDIEKINNELIACQEKNKELISDNNSLKAKLEEYKTKLNDNNIKLLNRKDELIKYHKKYGRLPEYPKKY